MEDLRVSCGCSFDRTPATKFYLLIVIRDHLRVLRICFLDPKNKNY